MSQPQCSVIAKSSQQRCQNPSKKGSSKCSVHSESKKTVDFNLSQNIKKIPSRKDYSKQELDNMYKNWNVDTQQEQTSRQTQRCSRGDRSIVDICTTDYPCWEKSDKLCYSVDGQYYVYPPNKATQISHQIKRARKNQQQLSELPLRQVSDRRTIHFDQRMDRGELSYLYNTTKRL